MSRVAGHALVLGGIPHDDAGRKVNGRVGKAKCQCGWVARSVAGTNAQRQRAHREHKQQVAERFSATVVCRRQTGQPWHIADIDQTACGIAMPFYERRLATRAPTCWPCIEARIEGGA